MATDAALPKSRASVDALAPVHFRFRGHLAPNASTVSVIGSFNGWRPQGHEMKRTLEGDWYLTIYMPLDCRILYVFSVDGAVWLDPDDDGRIPNEWGSEYSVRNVCAVNESTRTTPAQLRRRKGILSRPALRRTVRPAPRNGAT